MSSYAEIIGTDRKGVRIRRPVIIESVQLMQLNRTRDDLFEYLKIDDVFLSLEGIEVRQPGGRWLFTLSGGNWTSKRA